MANVLVTGGAGYIGSHIVRQLVESGRSVEVLDDLSAGHREAVGRVPLVQADFADVDVLDRLLGKGDVECVVHMAAVCEVGESVADPAPYYTENVTKSLVLMDAMRKHNVRNLVFSSTAAVYGEPQEELISENHPQIPTNTYGETKLAVERALAWYHRAYDLRYVALRYFNAAGAHPNGDIGEDHPNETRLIPRLLRATHNGGPDIPIYGEDYPTRDGTCLRDYVHVVDLARAHVRALECLEQGKVTADSFNLGTGDGYTVREVLDVIEKVVGRRPPTVSASRREGDPAVLVASSARAAEHLGWKPEYTLEEIVESAWGWHQRRPEGYATAV